MPAGSINAPLAPTHHPVDSASMTAEPENPPPGMIGTPPSASRVPLDPGLHARDFARRYAEPLDGYCKARMRELGIPDEKNGEPDYGGDGRWRAFNPDGMKGGGNTTGVTVDSGVLNPTCSRGRRAVASGPGCDSATG